MKKLLLLAAAALLGACCNRTTEAPQTQSAKDVFAKGSLLEKNPNFTGEAWLEMFVTATDSMDCTVGNVTFAPGVRNGWHSHPGGQILLCTSGKGLYQERGGAVRELRPGDVVKIAPAWYTGMVRPRRANSRILPSVRRCRKARPSGSARRPITNRMAECYGNR